MDAKKDSSSSKQKATVAPIKESPEPTQLPKQAPLIEKPKVEVEEVETTNEPVRIRKASPEVSIKASSPKPIEEVLPDPPTQQTEEPAKPKVELLEPQVSIKDESQQRIQSASPPEDPPQEERCISEASTAESFQEDDKPLTNDEQKMLAATTEIMRQLNALDVDTVRVISAPKAKMDSDDDLEDNGTLLLRFFNIEMV